MGGRIDDPMLWDWTDFWSSDEVELMTADQALAYVRLLSIQWRDGDLPSDPRLLAAKLTSGVRQYSVRDLVGYTPPIEDGPNVRQQEIEGTLEAPLEGSLWAGLKDCFTLAEGSLYNVRVANDRLAWKIKKDAWKNAGKRGGKASAATRAKKAKARKPAPPAASKPPLNPPSSQGEATLQPGSSQPQAIVDSLSPSLSPSSSTSNEEKKPPTEVCAESTKTPTSPPPPLTTNVSDDRAKPKAPTAAQLIKKLAKVPGLEDFADLWTERLRQTIDKKRPNPARQEGQLKKLLKGIGIEGARTVADVREIVGLATDGGWSGFTWKYLDEHRQREAQRGNGRQRARPVPGISDFESAAASANYRSGFDEQMRLDEEADRFETEKGRRPKDRGEVLDFLESASGVGS